MTNNLKKAEDLLKSGNYTCVFCGGNETIVREERGVKPLLELLDSGGDVRGYSAADKVVGKGAAFLYVLLGVKEVYSPVMSELAIQVFEENGIYFKFDKSVKNIINRAGTGICPMEDAVQDISGPNEALKAIRARLNSI